MKLAELNLKNIQPSVANTRAPFEEAPMAELVKSIESVGLINPITVRELDGPGGEYEIIAGHRRYYAMRWIGKETIPANVVDATDEEAAQIRIIENLHREDLNPVEEAEAFGQLRNKHLMDTDGIARRADKSLAYVTRSLALLDLPKAVVQAIRAGQLTAEHGHQIARAAEDKRERLAKFATTVNSWTKRMPDIHELTREIEKSVEKPLAVAPFPKDEAHYGGDAMPSCLSCVFNTGNQSVLFDGAKEGKCTNPGCYTKRTNAFYKAMAAEVAGRWPGVEFLGVKARRGADEFGGFRAVDLKKVKDDLKAHPEKYAFGIWKTEPYGPKKPEVVLVRFARTEAEKQEARRDDHDYERDRAIAKVMRGALLAAALTKVRTLTAKEVRAMIGRGLQNTWAEALAEATGQKGTPDVERWLGTQSDRTALWLLFIDAHVNTYQIDPKEWSALGINAKEIITKTAKLAGAQYDEAKKKTTKEKS